MHHTSHQPYFSTCPKGPFKARVSPSPYKAHRRRTRQKLYWHNKSLCHLRAEWIDIFSWLCAVCVIDSSSLPLWIVALARHLPSICHYSGAAENEHKSVVLFLLYPNYYCTYLGYDWITALPPHLKFKRVKRDLTLCGRLTKYTVDFTYLELRISLNIYWSITLGLEKFLIDQTLH